MFFPISLFFTLVAVVFQGYFSLLTLFLFVWEVLIFSFFLTLIFRVFQRFRRETFSRLWLKVGLTFASVFGIFVTIFLGVITYHNSFPWELADISLSNGSGGNIVFLEMSHIASADFYNQKKQTIQKLEKEWFTFIVEWVRPGSGESEKILDASLGIDFTPTLYKTVSDLISLDFQDNATLFAGVSSGALAFVDISVDDIAGLLQSSSGDTLSGSLLPIVDIEREIASFASGMTTKDKVFLNFLARGMLNASLKSSDDIALLFSTPEKKRLLEVLLDERNKKVLEYIDANPNKKIAIVYGALHFNGIFEALQSQNPPWKIEKIEKYIPYKN